MEIKTSETQPNTENQEFINKLYDLFHIGTKELNSEFQKQAENASERSLKEIDEVTSILETIDDALTVNKNEYQLTKFGLVKKAGNSYLAGAFVRNSDLNEDGRFNLDNGPVKFISFQILGNVDDKIYDQSVENVMDINNYTVRCFITKVSWQKNKEGKNDLKFEEEDGLVFKLNSKNITATVALSKHYATRDLVDQRPIDLTKNSQQNSQIIRDITDKAKSIEGLGK